MSDCSDTEPICPAEYPAYTLQSYGQSPGGINYSGYGQQPVVVQLQPSAILPNVKPELTKHSNIYILVVV